MTRRRNYFGRTKTLNDLCGISLNQINCVASVFMTVLCVCLSICICVCMFSVVGDERALQTRPNIDPGPFQL